MTCFHFDIGSRARHAGRFIGRVRGELLKALLQRKSEGHLPQQALADKLGIERSLINRQLSGEAALTLRSLADLAWAMDMEISFALKAPETSAGQNHPAQNHPITTSTIGHGQIRYINGSAKRVSGCPAPAKREGEQAKRSA